MDLHVRKHPRLKEYDYSQNGAYFVTVCTKDRACILSRIVGRGFTPAETELTELGILAEEQLIVLPVRYPFLSVRTYVIMPNHIHTILEFNDKMAGAIPAGASTAGTGVAGATPAGASPRPTTLSDVVCTFKSLTTRSAGQKIWQASFHDHIIRDEKDFLIHWKYIEDNPSRWAEDEYFINRDSSSPCLVCSHSSV